MPAWEHQDVACVTSKLEGRAGIESRRMWGRRLRYLQPMTPLFTVARYKALIALLILIAATPAAVDENSRRFGFGQDGNYFLVKCTKALQALDSNDQAIHTKQDAYNVGYCEGLVSALATDLVFGGRVDLDKSRPSVRQLIQVPIKYMNDHREQLHESSVELIGVSLEEAFPSKP